MARSAWLALLFVVGAACATGPGGPNNLGADTSATSLVSSDATVERDHPPDLVVVAGDDQLTLTAFSYCWSTESAEQRQVACADGAPPDPLSSITLADTADLAIVFPLPWNIQAQFLPDGEYCNGALVVDADPAGAPIKPPGPAGTYRVDLFGRGDQGDASWAFELVTTTSGEPPPPYAQVFWYPSGSDLEADASFSVLVGNIATQPASVTGSVAVTAGNGASKQYDLTAEQTSNCWEGTVSLDAGTDFTGDVLSLGPSPYDVTVSATIDGAGIISDPVRWPDDFPTDSNESSRLATTVDPSSFLPEDFDLPEGNEPVARFAFGDGYVVMIKDEQAAATYYWAAELFTGGGEGFVGGGPGETWQGCYRVDYSNAGYAIVIVEDPGWTVTVDGKPVDVTAAGDVAMGLVKGTFDRPPPVTVTNSTGKPAC